MVIDVVVASCGHYSDNYRFYYNYKHQKSEQIWNFHIRLLTTGHWKVGGAVEKVHSQVNVEAGIYMREPRDGSAAGSLASPAWNSTRE